MAINPNTDFSSGAVLTAAQQNRFPRGVMAYSTKTTDYAATTTMADIGLSATFTAVANRYYKYTFAVYATDSSAASFIYTTITDSSNVVKGDNYTVSLGAGRYLGYTFSYVSTESAGSVTRKVRANVGAGTATLYAGSGHANYIYLLVEDIGPA